MKSILLKDTVGQKSENLQIVRFIAAIMVVISHSFNLSTGSLANEWGLVLTNGQFTMGAMAVSVFFLCGGYLIAMSMEKAKTGAKYFEARLIRLLPPLFFVTLLVTLLGGLLTTLSPIDYYTSVNTWKYMLNSVFVLTHNLPGVFEGNVLNATVNGALWTLPVEFICYILCFIAYKLGFMNKKRFPWSIPLVCIGSAAVWYVGGIIPLVREVVRPVLLFYIGMGYWIYREHIKLNVKYMAFAIIGLFVLFFLNMGFLAKLLFFPYIMMTLWFGCKQCSSKIGKLGNYSYGIYLWGFPIQQTIIHFFGGEMNSYVNFLIAIPITIVFGIITYELSERRFVKWYKNHIHLTK